MWPTHATAPRYLLRSLRGSCTLRTQCRVYHSTVSGLRHNLLSVFSELLPSPLQARNHVLKLDTASRLSSNYAENILSFC